MDGYDIPLSDGDGRARLVLELKPPLAQAMPEALPQLPSFDPDADYRSEDGSVELSHRNGLPWWKAPQPPSQHDCSAQTSGFKNYINLVERCACGAIRLDGRGPWQERNSRREDSGALEAKSRPGRWSRWLAR